MAKKTTSPRKKKSITTKDGKRRPAVIPTPERDREVILREDEQRPDPTSKPLPSASTRRRETTRTPSGGDSSGSASNSGESRSPDMSPTIEHVLQPLPPRPAPAYDHTPTDEQRAIIEAARALVDDHGHLVAEFNSVLVIEAGAGTGKTSTLKMLEQVLVGRGQYTAFNRSLVDESKAKFRRCSCKTTHGLAFATVGKQFSHRLGGDRVRADQIARQLGIEALGIQVAGLDKPKVLQPGLLASWVLVAVRKFCQSADREIEARHFRYVDGIDLPTSAGERTWTNNEVVREYLLPFAQAAWEDLSRPDGQLPYTHDYYVKLWQLGDPQIGADYVLLDEAQDTAEVMLDVFRRQRSTLTILVGDSAQQIYEWRGAVNAMRAFPGAVTRQLSQSWRFGEGIAQLANRVLGLLEEPVALRLRGNPSLDSRIYPIAEPRAILCRTNAGAISEMLRQIALGRKAFLVGGGADVVAFVEGADALQRGRRTTHPELACFESWREVQAYAKLDEGEDLKLMVKIVDEFGCQVILDALRRMPEERHADVVVSTAHKSKGKEWPTVKLGGDFPPPAKCGDPELRLVYVALTRCKLGLDISECPFFIGEHQKFSRELDGDEELGRTGEFSPGIDMSGLEQWTCPLAEVAPTNETESDIPAAPVTPPSQPIPVQNGRPAGPPTQYSWAKGKQGDWLVRGPTGSVGMEVNVYRRDGSCQSKVLRSLVWEGNGAALYKV